ncbi:protein s-acyltransferase 11 [Phtheirospermum japonicum]|uniref:Protein s-acyltransferase 11 n=1 Tax=Phtheirospermum japonicum TaxID=374723 RepID=A0A830BH50_9LAMI|nr:protein s-acyltransferase 11 [Phtheirospermum japonicum]
MDLANSGSPSSANHDGVQAEDNQLPPVTEDLETNCWGCGLRVLVSPFASIFKCGWCGAITKQNVVKTNNKYIRFRRWRDTCFVCIVVLFMLRPRCFSLHISSDIVYMYIIIILPLGVSASWSSANDTMGQLSDGRERWTRELYFLSLLFEAEIAEGPPLPFVWGVRVGHGSSLPFLLGTLYVATMTSYAAHCIWPPLDRKPATKFSGFVNFELLFGVVKENVLSFLRSAVFLPMRGLVLVYLFIASVSVGIGLSVLLWQQLSYIYAGKTYLSHLSAVDSEEIVERDCQNLVRFFGCPHGATVYLPSYWKSRKSHDK